MTKTEAERELNRQRAAEFTEDLAPLGDITLKAMFGGHGIFESGVMFAMLDSNGIARLRADDETSPALIAAGGEQLQTMPYWSIGDDVRTDPDRLIEWASTALAVARAAKRPKKRKKK